MNTIELVVFDMAGTVVNEKNIVYKTLQKSINQKGFELDLAFVLKHGAGKEKYQAICDILSKQIHSFSAEMIDEIFMEFQKLLKIAYENLYVDSYSGVVEFVKYLKENHIKIALNTGYDTNTAQLLLHKMNWKKGNHYDALITADDVKQGRPHPDMIYVAMKLCGVDDPKKVIKVGDTTIDIEEGKNANCGFTIGVTTGAHNRKQLKASNPNFIIDNMIEVKSLLENQFILKKEI